MSPLIVLAHYFGIRISLSIYYLFIFPVLAHNFLFRHSIQVQTTNFYVSAEDAGALPLIANRYTASGWETFAFSTQAGGFWAITATANGKLVAIQPANGNQVTNKINKIKKKKKKKKK